MAIRESSDAGRPAAAGDGPIADVYRDLAARLVAGLEGEARAFPKIVME